jgi:hypothetical protein
MSQFDVFTPMDQPVLVTLQTLPRAPVQQACFAPAGRPPIANCSGSIPVGVTLPQPCIPGFQIFAPPLTMHVLPRPALIPQCLPQTPAHWTRMPTSIGAVHTPKLSCPSVPQSGFIPQANLVPTCLPPSPPLFRPLQPPNSTPDFLSWG